MNETLESMARIAAQASSLIARIYRTGYSKTLKTDKSPVTSADLKAHELIERRLQQLDPSLPVLSEESDKIAFDRRRTWTKHWLVDPLDGTRDFIAKNGEFTVNIALIEGTRPTLGVVGVPMLNRVYLGDCERMEAWRLDGMLRNEISTRRVDLKCMAVVCSRFHLTPRESRFHERMKSSFEGVRVRRIGSSLKIVMIAEGKADLHFKCGPTSEWDTAASDAVLTSAGGVLADLQGEPLAYNTKDSLQNPPFLAIGDPNRPWLEHLSQGERSQRSEMRE